MFCSSSKQSLKLAFSTKSVLKMFFYTLNTGWYMNCLAITMLEKYQVLQVCNIKFNTEISFKLYFVTRWSTLQLPLDKKYDVYILLEQILHCSCALPTYPDQWQRDLYFPYRPHTLLEVLMLWIRGQMDLNCLTPGSPTKRGKKMVRSLRDQSEADHLRFHSLKIFQSNS